MRWTETNIARLLALQFFQKKHLVVVPNCNWTGYECDLLVVADHLRVIDVEIKISRADLKADRKKSKWWESYRRVGNGWQHFKPPLEREHPHKVWKHYYAMPEEIWKPELLDVLPSKSSGVLLLRVDKDGRMSAYVERRAKPARDAEPLSPEQAVDVARLASLRMWDSYRRLDELQSKGVA